MGKSQQSFNKKERENKKKKKAKDKLEKRLQRKEEKALEGPKTFEEQLSYVDEFGNISDTPPDPTKKRTEVKLEDIVIGVPARVAVDLNAERTGKVKFFNSEKGFGFIDQDNGEDNIFVHINSVAADELKENQKVSYKIEKGDKGWVAIQVKIIG